MVSDDFSNMYIFTYYIYIHVHDICVMYEGTRCIQHTVISLKYWKLLAMTLE